MVPPEIAANPALAAVARTLLLDAVAVDCISVLRTKGIRTILLKGPVTARWLYSASELRQYTDIDLLVDPAEFSRASRTLQQLGCRDTLAGRLPHETAPHARTFRMERSSIAGAAGVAAGLWVDLHWSFHGVNAPAPKFWTVVTQSAERMRISGTVVDVPGAPIRALLLALHAARSGAEAGKPLADLDRALEILADDTWRAGHGLALRLDAAALFVTGLAMRPLGRELIARLDLGERIDATSALYAGGVPPVAGGLERLIKTAGPRARAALLARELIPTRSFMRAWSPLARRGVFGLGVSYAYRPLWLLARLPAALRAHARARRVARAGALGISDAGPDRP